MRLFVILEDFVRKLNVMLRHRDSGAKGKRNAENRVKPEALAGHGGSVAPLHDRVLVGIKPRPARHGIDELHGLGVRRPTVSPRATEYVDHMVALVSDLTLHLQPGYNAITGETGAGKSIIMGALNLLLGERADRALLRAGCESCSVEAVFDGASRGAVMRVFLIAGTSIL